MMHDDDDDDDDGDDKLIRSQTGFTRRFVIDDDGGDDKLKVGCRSNHKQCMQMRN